MITFSSCLFVCLFVCFCWGFLFFVCLFIYCFGVWNSGRGRTKNVFFFIK